MKITIIMPLKNLNNFLLDTLDSISKQNYKFFTLLVICPSSEYIKINCFFSNLSLPFPYEIIHTSLYGIAFAANLGIAHSTSEFVARWDSDDLSDSHRFQRQIEEFMADPNLAIVGTRVVIINENGDPDQFHKFKFYSTSKNIRTALKYRQPFLHSSLMFRRDILLINKGYLYGNTSEDHELFIRIARNNAITFKNIEDVTTYYRRHPDQLSDISNIKYQFYEVSGFLFTEFLRTRNPLYLVGIVANVPLIRKSRHFYRNLLKNVTKFKNKVAR
jgi:glycosyltransferase involved in cell wall biosynthesis